MEKKHAAFVGNFCKTDHGRSEPCQQQFDPAIRSTPSSHGVDAVQRFSEGGFTADADDGMDLLNRETESLYSRFFNVFVGAACHLHPWVFWAGDLCDAY